MYVGAHGDQKKVSDSTKLEFPAPVGAADCDSQQEQEVL